MEPDHTGSRQDRPTRPPDPAGRVAVLCGGFLMPVVGSLTGGAVAPIFLGMAGLLILLATFRDHRFPAPDRWLLGLVLLLVGIGAASYGWSIVPERTLRMTAQIGLLLPGLALVFAPRIGELRGSGDLAAPLAAGIAVAAVFLIAEWLFGHPALRLAHGLLQDGSLPLHEYKRGVSYIVVLAWPAAAFVWMRRGAAPALLLVAVSCGLALLVGARTAGGAAAAGLVVLALAWAWPRLARIGLAGFILAAALGSPLLLGALLDLPAGWLGHLPLSAVHRLEIWDYIANAIQSRPVLGWGLHSSSHLPLAPGQLSHYLYATTLGSHPHNVFLQLWTELGALGIASVSAIIILVFVRIGRMPPRLQPFSLACFASVFCIAMSSYQAWSDSWLSTMAAAAFAFSLLRHEPSCPCAGSAGGASCKDKPSGIDSPQS